MLNLINEIDKYLMEEVTRERKGHYPSDVLSCRRQLFYKWKCIPQTDPPTPGSLLKMKMGDIIHAWVTDILSKCGFDLAVENEDNDGKTKKFKDHRLKKSIRYRTDAIFYDDEGVRSLIEIKSSYGPGIKEIQLNGPKDSQFAQVLLYMMVEQVQRVYMVFIGRDNGYRTQHIQEADIIDSIFVPGDYYIDNVRIDGIPAEGNPRYEMKYKGELVPITYDNMVLKFKEIETWIDGNELPPRDYMAAIKNGEVQRKYQYQKKLYSSDWQCSYCYWKSKCWAEELKIYSNSNNAEMFKGNKIKEQKNNNLLPDGSGRFRNLEMK